MDVCYIFSAAEAVRGQKVIVTYLPRPPPMQVSTPASSLLAQAVPYGWGLLALVRATIGLINTHKKQSLALINPVKTSF